MLCSMPIISCGGRSATLLDEEDDVDDSRRVCVQLFLLAMLVVVANDRLCSMLSSSRRCHLDLVLSDAALDGTRGNPSDPDVLALVVGSLVV